MFVSWKKVALASAVAMVTGQAFAADVNLAVTVSGTRSAAPTWQDSSSATVTTLDFAFSGAAGTAAANVDSATVQARLVNALTYPASIAVTAPSTCTIGADVVAGADVKIMYNAAEAGATVTLASGLQNFGVRFAAAGNYGDKAGVVACAGNGNLRYSY